MMELIKKGLRRNSFPGQMRLFHFLFKKKLLKDSYGIAVPVTGNFLIHADTTRLIDARIVYTGDYEPEIKKIFKAVIKSGNIILDIGANIGFHTLYFSELTGEKGKVIAFEPVPVNFEALSANVKLNGYNNILANNLALSDKNETICINIDKESSNPGAFNLFDTLNGSLDIDCRIGDEIVKELQINRIDFIKIDVEGYELYVLKGLSKSIEKYRPRIVFEYDKNYQLKTGINPLSIFDLLSQLNYAFYKIDTHGLAEVKSESNLISADILALPL